MTHDYGTCHVCGGVMKERMIDHTLGEADDWLVVRDVPTGVCTKCGEKILRWEVLRRLEEIVQQRNQALPLSLIEVPVFAF